MGGAQARWRSDGKELFYVALDGELMAVPIQLDSDRLKIRAGTPVPLFMTHLAGGVVQAINKQQYTPTSDGRRFLMRTVTDYESTVPITIVLNWKTGKE